MHPSLSDTSLTMFERIPAAARTFLAFSAKVMVGILIITVFYFKSLPCARNMSAILFYVNRLKVDKNTRLFDLNMLY